MPDVVDFWVNVVPEGAGADFLKQGYGIDPGGGVIERAVEVLLEQMDEHGVATSVVTAGLVPPSEAAGKGLLTIERLLQIADEHPGRFLVSAVVDEPTRPVKQAARVRELRQHEAFVLVRVIPLLTQVPLNDRLFYPVYATCAELGVPVGVNVGIPGPLVRSACQHPTLLEDLLIDFRGLPVIASHMGHPYEELLITYMRKWRSLSLASTAYLPGYMDPAVVAFLDSSAGRGRVLFGSDAPFVSVGRAVASAKALDVAEDSLAAYLGGAARTILSRGGPA